MGNGERRRVIVLGAILGVVLLGAIAKFTIFSGGGGGSGTASGTTLSLPRGIAEQTTTTKPSSRSTGSPATFDVFATKNPFEPVIIVTPPDATTPTTGGTGSTIPTTPGPGGTGGTTPPTVTTVPSDQPPAGTSVALLDVFQASDGTPKAKVRVGSTVYTVGDGMVFATSYRVVSLNAPCGQFLFGDAPFKLCVGEEVIK
jgi:hypothetical protein